MSLDAVSMFNSSPIIGGNEEWMKTIFEKLGPHLVDAKMIFNAKEDGWKAKDFHKKCDLQGPTISFIQIKDGPIVGGFTTAQWRNADNDFVSDRYAFIFNLTDGTFLPIRKSERAMACHKDNGPTYGNGDLVVFSKFNETGHLRSMTDEPQYNIQEIKGKNQITNSS